MRDLKWRMGSAGLALATMLIANQAAAGCYQTCKRIPMWNGITTELRVACTLTCVADSVANAQQRY
jgi:hypothetical protein